MGRSVCLKQKLDRQGTPSLYQHHVSTARYQPDHEESYSWKTHVVISTGVYSRRSSMTNIHLKLIQFTRQIADPIQASTDNKRNPQYNLNSHQSYEYLATTLPKNILTGTCFTKTKRTNNEAYFPSSFPQQIRNTIQILHSQIEQVPYNISYT